MREKPAVTLTDGSPVTDDHRELKENGQQMGYVVLSAEERVKGFVRPVRRSYLHLGLPAPAGLRDLTDDEKASYAEFGYAKFEPYGEDRSPWTGKFWTKAELAKVDNGCGVLTTMSNEIAETYARNPKFYGSTFCCGCGVHLPVAEFVWDGTIERVGS